MGFSLKKLVKKVTSPFAKVADVVLDPVKSVVDKVFGGGSGGFEMAKLAQLPLIEAAQTQAQKDAVLAETQEVKSTESPVSEQNILKRRRNKKAGRDSLRIDLAPSLGSGGYGPPTIGV
jgi:hypothetical protein